MSEELIQRGLRGGGRVFGFYEYLNVGNTTLASLRDAQLIPARDYDGYEGRKPDGLIIDNRGKTPRVVAVVEFKKDIRRQHSGIAQAATVAAALGAKFCLVTDGERSLWLLPDVQGKYNPIHSENGAPMDAVFSAPEAVSPTKADELAQLIALVDEQLEGDRLTGKRTLNPSALARSVWQDIYTSASTPPPERALATFVEIFMFKYLSDLGVLTTDRNGTDISFDAVLTRPAEQCLRYYSRNVRGHIKAMFPESTDDRTTIMNGFSLNPENTDHNHVFRKILQRFKDFEVDPSGGKLVGIDKEFKSRLFEDFLKGSVGQRSLGQFFTPRRLMAGIVDMANVEALPIHARVGDPACGVGGFPLEAAARRASRLRRSDFRVEFREEIVKRRRVQIPIVVSDIDYRGSDKGSDRQDDNLTIILAKANFVIYQSDLLARNPSATEAMAVMFNRMFRAYTDTSLGSLSEIEESKYDLILSNPPYVASGSANLKEAARRAGLNYTAGGTGVEGMFVEKIVRELKPGGRAFVILPDGIFLRAADSRLREWVQQHCFVDAIVSLPVRTFFATSKKTYVLCVTRKSNHDLVQEFPVFAYLVTSIGETLDATRFPTLDTDMPEMARLFRAFVAVRDRLAEDKDAAANLQSPRLKLIPAHSLLESESWAVDRLFWSKSEKVDLGIDEEKPTMTETEFFDALRTVRDNLSALLSDAEED